MQPTATHCNTLHCILRSKTAIFSKKKFACFSREVFFLHHLETVQNGNPHRGGGVFFRTKWHENYLLWHASFRSDKTNTREFSLVISELSLWQDKHKRILSCDMRALALTRQIQENSLLWHASSCSDKTNTREFSLVTRELSLWQDKHKIILSCDTRALALTRQTHENSLLWHASSRSDKTNTRDSLLWHASSRSDKTNTREFSLVTRELSLWRDKHKRILSCDKWALALTRQTTSERSLWQDKPQTTQDTSTLSGDMWALSRLV